MTWVRARSLVFPAFLWVALVSGRLIVESPTRVVGGNAQSYIGSRWDLRGFARHEELLRLRESQAFRARLRQGQASPMSWPGLKAMQVSWTWLELLQNMHQPSSYEGDFSWMFSKFHTIIEHSSPEELRFVSGLAPFFIVIGKDPIGATVVMNELIRRDPQGWKSWFWYGYHALDNLQLRNLAGDAFTRTAELPGGPPFTAALSLRLSRGASFFDLKDRDQILRENFSAEFIDKIKRARPEYFEPSPRS